MTTTLFAGGVIHTNRSETDGPGWVLVDEDRIVGAGGRDAGSAPAADRVVDLAGGTLMPAFCDAHVHLPATGLAIAGMSFRNTRSARAILSAFDQRASSGEILYGSGFEDPLDGPLTRAELDAVVGDRPAMLTRADLHSCIVSTALLDRLDIASLTQGIDRDADGRPTGFLRELAASAAWRWFEENLPRSQSVDATQSAMRLAYSKGVATVHEMFVVEWKGWHAYDVFREAIEGRALEVVVYVGTDDVEKVVSLGVTRIGEFFLDGSFGSHTAWMKEPFTSMPPAGSPAAGIPYRDDDELFQFLSTAHGAGIQVALHAIGDAAIEQAITVWEKVAAVVGGDKIRRMRHRIEHFECASDDHMARAARVGLTASVQPAFDAFWGGPDGLYSERIGWERARDMNRFGSMIDAGLVLGAGSDSTVTPLDPLLQLRSLRTHHLANERLAGRTAVNVHTLGGHILAGMNGDHGRLDEGAVANLVWLDRDPVSVDPDELDKVEVLGTWVGGKRVFPFDEAEAE